MSDLTQISTDERMAALIGRFIRRGGGPESLERIGADPVPCPKSAADVRIGWYVPPRHRKDTLANYQPRSASQREALDATAAWIEAAAQGEGPTLALVGAVGTGKSHLMYAAVTELNRRGVNAGAWGWFDLALLLRDAKFARDEESNAKARYERDRLFSVRSIAIDEVRPTAGTDFDATELSQLMTRAYREKQAVIVTSNYADRGLTEIIGLAAHSRLTQVVLDGPDFRRQPRLRAVS